MRKFISHLLPCIHFAQTEDQTAIQAIEEAPIFKWRKTCIYIFHVVDSDGVLELGQWHTIYKGPN